MTATIRTTGESRGISARGLRKAYGEKVVLDGVDLDVMPGTIFALLGPNGAGKTTTVRILSTLIGADEGRATVAGHSLREAPDAVRAEIGVSGQYAAVDGLLTVEENLLLIADLLHLDRAEGKRRAAELLERFGIADVARKAAASLSGRTRRRLHLAMALVGRPSVVFLDEPTTGLDPRVRRTVWDIVRDLAAGGTTVFLTTQYLEEADQLADRIAVLDGGKIVAEGTAEELKRRIPGGHIRLRFNDIRQLNAATDRLALSTVTRDDTELTLQVSSDGRIPVLRAVLDVLEASGIQAEALTVHTPDLDDVFLALTGRDRGSGAARPR
ncbi:ATP-binding cassette domain-containing protein [Streptomyces spectabilis]|uniref:ABC-type xenobiotic transporter n=1 Tax=Streptomyces spectabilis TaxID=68270 RepID=A0A516RGK2_STRST|nr:ATP-binding cassette domain-containing protein [Streptomyces spectabilis]QDQ14782.1 ATP-binding cassette domain-containing protein [Streptomyces spectabilis]